MFFPRSLAYSCGLTLALLACAAPPVVSPAARLPTYGAEDAALLDDGFSGHLFETAFVTGVAGDDSHFDARVRAAESIWLLKVATVSREGSVDASRRYGLVFRPLENLVGPPPASSVSLTISAKDPSFHWLDRVGGAWVGHEVLLMVRSYRSGESITRHFHGEPNTPELRAKISAIRAAASHAERAAPPAKK